jgi:NitT/TauT family transport system permease protein
MGRFGAVLGICLVLGIWQLASRSLHLPAYLLPAPTDVANASVKNWALLLAHTIPTAATSLAGFALSIVIGIPLAVAIVHLRWAESTVLPLIIGAQAIPKVAIAPLFIVWFGFGPLPKILIAFFIAFFPVVVDTVVGLRAADPEMLQLVRSMGGSTLQTFTKVRFPNALPSIFGGLKVAITLSVVGAVVGEFVGSNAGLGYLVLMASGNLNAPLVFACVVTLAALGLLFFYALDFIERRMTYWYVPSNMDRFDRTTM